MSSSETTNDSQNNLSLNVKKVESKEDNYRRDSFEDRFCDDLCEDILQYLPLKDRFRFECVSKQFQRTVFQNLYKLDLDDTDVWLTQILDTLAEKSEKLNCFQKLKSLSIAFSETDLKEFLPELKAFPALKTLKLWTDINEWVYFDQVINFSKLFSFEAFKGLSNITHLTLHLNLRKYFNETLNEDIIKEIDIYLPNLQYLEIKDVFHTTPEGVTQMADILSRLSRLETLKLKFKPGVDFKQIEEQITEKCRKLRKKEIGIDLNYFEFDLVLVEFLL